MWMSQDAMELQVPVPTIDTAVALRNLSAFKDERETASQSLKGPSQRIDCDRDAFVKQLGEAMYAAMIITFAQGMAQLRCASAEHDYGLNLDDVARIWRGGCIIRAALLDEIRRAYEGRPALPNLLLDVELGKTVEQTQGSLRSVVRRAAEAGIPAAGFMSALAYFDAYRSAWLPANLIQAQRDFFGSHTYERLDAKGRFHTQWTRPEDMRDGEEVSASVESVR
jgi:6-phosphogluconate dehydrogenase